MSMSVPAHGMYGILYNGKMRDRKRERKRERERERERERGAW